MAAHITLIPHSTTILFDNLLTVRLWCPVLLPSTLSAPITYYRAMVPISIPLMNTMKESGMLARDQDGAGCTTLMDQYMKGSGTMINVMGMAY